MFPVFQVEYLIADKKRNKHCLNLGTMEFAVEDTNLEKEYKILQVKRVNFSYPLDGRNHVRSLEIYLCS